VGSPISYFFEGYRPDRRITVRRARLEQDVVDELAKLSDQEVGLAARLVKAIRAGD
jgi:hypothetical protein